jgi:hypothetical protein
MLTWPSSQLRYDKVRIIGNAITLGDVWGPVRTHALKCTLNLRWLILKWIMCSVWTKLWEATYTYSYIQIEMLWPLLTFNGDTMIHGLLCTMHDISKYKSVFLPIRQTPCHIFSKRIVIISLIMYLNIRKLKLYKKLVMELKVLKELTCIKCRWEVLTSKGTP